MHGRGGEERKRTRHMWKAPTRGNPTISAAGDVSSSSSSSVDSFCKDGRKISIGDCALFKPPDDRPPFIGIIRWLTVGKENKLKLGVNWLYRPTEVKLGKGVLLEAAPNEIFYTFHKDEIPAASVLHPCKVAFLPKGIKPPPGISSFVCQRVYDIANKRLCWLTDQDYINEHQEEVDKLLYRTRIEMHTTVQSGGRSPKPMSSPTSTSLLKSGSESVQNTASSFPPHVKGRKRERVDQGSEPVKRERITKIEDGDSGHFREDSIIKAEIAKITEKGGLVDTEGVEKLVKLMIPDWNEKKIDLASRAMLAAVIAATDKYDCLSQFVQLRGLPVFDEWLQEVHKGKIGDGKGSRDGDKSVEEFLLVLLRALDKLPVNLQALQTCNIGKSVNHLRTHKSSEIQRKARGLVDTWKKRVEAEMNINDAKSGSGQTIPWPARPRVSEVAQAGLRHSGGSSDVVMKSSVTQVSASKTASVKTVQGENTTRSASPVSMKSVPLPVSATMNSKDGQPHGAASSGASDLPSTNAKDDRSCSSSQSHNNSQSCSSDHVKTGGISAKEDTRSSTAMSVNKISGSTSRHWKLINGFPSSAPSGGQKEIGSSRNSSLHKNSTLEKMSQSGLPEKALDGTSLEGTTKLIVKIPNRGRSPTHCAGAGSFDDPSITNSQPSSPVISEKHDHFDRSSKEKSDFCRTNAGSDVNTESWQSNDFKDVLTGSDEGDGSPAAVTDEEHCRTGCDSKKMLEASKDDSSSSGNENKTGNLQDASVSSMTALVESCVKYSEANASVLVADDVGMNLLASVAAGEISKSELVTPAGSPERNVTTIEQSHTGDAIVKSSEEDLVRDECHSNDSFDDEHKKLNFVSGDLLANNDGNNFGSLVTEGKAVAEHNKHSDSSSEDSQQVTENCLESKGKLSEKTVTASLAGFSESTIEETRDGNYGKQLKEKKLVERVSAGGNQDVKVGYVSRLETGTNEKTLLHPSGDADVRGDNCTSVGLSSGVQTPQKPPAILMQSDPVKGKDENALQPTGCSLDKDNNEQESGKIDDMAAQNHASQSQKQKNDQRSDALAMPENRGLGVSEINHDVECVEENSETKEVRDQCSGQILHKASPSIPSQEMDQCLGPRGSKLIATEVEEAEECTSTTADASPISAPGVSDMDAKVEFDLNESFNADDGKCGKINCIREPGCAPPVRLISPVPYSASSMSSGIPVSITVAAAAKGPFVPPEDLLKNKGEPGWKGSAATSAFRPAEPRKVMELPLVTPATPIPDAASGKQSRPALDIDLNVPDDRIIDDVTSQTCAYQTDSVSLPADGCDPGCNKTIASPVCCSGGLGLDLNQVDETSDVDNCSTSNSHKMDVPLLQVKSSCGGPPKREVSVCRDFDLNNGPAVDEVSIETSFFNQHAKSIVPSQPPVSGLRMSSSELGNLSSWFPSTGNTYSAVTLSSVMPDRGDQPFSIVAPSGPQRVLGPATGSSPFGPDAYRGPVLSSSPAVPYPSTPFQYFPFNSSFPLPLASLSGGSSTYVDSVSGGRLCFPAVNSQLIGPAGTVSSLYPRPCVVSLPDGSNSSSAESSRKWGRQGLDLNAGPGGPYIEGKDETSSLVPRQLSVTSSQALVEEQARMFQLASGVLKRKEPDGGWDSYKQSSWQ